MTEQEQRDVVNGAKYQLCLQIRARAIYANTLAGRLYALTVGKDIHKCDMCHDFAISIANQVWDDSDDINRSIDCILSAELIDEESYEYSILQEARTKLCTADATLKPIIGSREEIEGGEK